MRGSICTDNVGKILNGFCDGFFGRDSYDEKIIEAEGSEWLVVRDEEGYALFANFSSEERKDALLKEWLSD